VKYKFLKITPFTVTQRQIMCAQTKENVVTADELVLRQEDEMQIHSTHPVAQFAVIWIIFSRQPNLKRRLLKV